MLTRISAGVGDNSCFFTFYSYDPYWLCSCGGEMVKLFLEGVIVETNI